MTCAIERCVVLARSLLCALHLALVSLFAPCRVDRCFVSRECVIGLSGDTLVRGLLFSFGGYDGCDGTSARHRGIAS